MASLCGLYLWHQGELPQPLGPILTWNELGMGRRLIAGSIPDRPWLVWGQGLVLAISLSGAVVLVAALVEGSGGGHFGSGVLPQCCSSMGSGNYCSLKVYGSFMTGTTSLSCPEALPSSQVI